VGDPKVRLEFLKVRMPLMAMDDQGVANIKCDADLGGIESVNQLAQLGKVSAEEVAAGMILDHATDADLFVQRGQFLELGADLEQLLVKLNVFLAIQETEPVKLHSELLCRAKNLFGVRRRGARNRRGQQSQSQTALTQTICVARQLFSGALRRDLTSRP